MPTSEREQNGHGNVDPSTEDTLDFSQPLPFHEPRRQSLLNKGWRVVTGRPARAQSDPVSGRETAVIQRWGWAITFILVQTVTIAWWASRTTTIVERHDKQLEAIDKIKEENIGLRSDVNSLNRQRSELSQYAEELAMWCGEVRTKLITTGRLQASDVPPLPQRNGRGY